MHVVAQCETAIQQLIYNSLYTIFYYMQSVCNVKVKLVCAYVCKMYMNVCTLLMYGVCRVYAMLKVKFECAYVCMRTIVCTLCT